jgi:hypothetical protein
VLHTTAVTAFLREKLEQGLSALRRSGRLAGKQCTTASGSAPSAEPSKSSSSTLTAEASTSTPTAEVIVAHAKLKSLEKDKTFYCRCMRELLDALLTHAPTVEGLNIIISNIITASAETNGLDQLAEFYITGLSMPSNLYIFISTSHVSMVFSEGWWSDTSDFISSFPRPANPGRGQQSCRRSRNSQKGPSNPEKNVIRVDLLYSLQLTYHIYVRLFTEMVIVAS